MPQKSNIAIFAPAVRVSRWMEFYDSVSQNKATFEIFFVGDVKPDRKLPPNLHYIYSTVKPAQCAYIGLQEALASNADFIVSTGDDCIYTQQSIDRLIGMFDKVGHDKFIPAPRFYTVWPGRKKEYTAHFLGQDGKYYKEKMPSLAIGVLMSQRRWREIGNPDRRFVCSYWDLDVTMQMHAIGGDVRVHPKARLREIKTTGKNSAIMPPEWPGDDRDLFYSLWCTLKPDTNKRFGPDHHIRLNKTKMRQGIVKVMKTRSVPLEPYENRDDILTASQGPKGKWD